MSSEDYFLDSPGPFIRKEREVKTSLDIFEQFARIISIAAIPIVIGIYTAKVQKGTQDQNINRDYVQLAVSVLKDKREETDPGLRDWAVDLLAQHSPTKFNPTVITALKSGNVTLPNPDSEKFVIRSASPDGTLTAITDNTNRVYVYDISQKRAFLFSVEGPPIGALDFSADSSKLAVGQDSGRINILDVQTGVKEAVFETGERLYTMKFLGSGQIQVVARLGTIYFFTEAGVLVKRIAFPNAPSGLSARPQ